MRPSPHPNVFLVSLASAGVIPQFEPKETRDESVLVLQPPIHDHPHRHQQWINYAGTYTTVGNNIYVTNPIGSYLFFRLKYWRRPFSDRETGYCTLPATRANSGESAGRLTEM